MGVQDIGSTGINKPRKTITAPTSRSACTDNGHRRGEVLRNFEEQQTPGTAGDSDRSRLYWLDRLMRTVRGRRFLPMEGYLQ
jgi:hypothetical protein